MKSKTYNLSLIFEHKLIITFENHIVNA